MDVTTIFTSIQEGLSITMSNYGLGSAFCIDWLIREAIIIKGMFRL